MNTQFRVTGFTENDGLQFTAALLPLPQTGEPFHEPKDLKAQLEALFEANKNSLIKNLCKQVKLICLDVWSNVEGSEKKVEKLEKLKFHIKGSEALFSEDFGMLNITIDITTSLTPIFEKGFVHKNSIYSEELNEEPEKTD